MGQEETNLKPGMARSRDEEYMRQAIRLARVALERADTPVRSVVVREGRIVAEGCELYTTAEPCFMCSFVIRSAHISRVVMGKAVPHIGGVSSKHPILIDAGIPNWPPPPVVVRGVLEKECNELFIR